MSCLIQRLFAILYKAKCHLINRIYRAFKCRPSSEPYISGDSLRAFAGHVYEAGDKKVLDFEEVRNGDVIFCESQLIIDFLDGPGKRMPYPFVLVSSNGDANISLKYLNHIPPNLTVWFAQNVAVRHPKIRPLPIGLENKALYWHGVTSDFDVLRRRFPEKKPRILYGFTVGTNESERGPALKVLSGLPVADSLARVNSRQYRRILASYQYVASPPGNGLDCHRTWEALYLGVIPIVRRSVAMEEFAKLLPIWIVDDYSELFGLSEEDLNSRYNAMWNSNWNKDALWFDYWKNEIEAFSRS